VKKPEKPPSIKSKALNYSPDSLVDGKKGEEEEKISFPLSNQKNLFFYFARMIKKFPRIAHATRL
jgi:hypothetical protein